MIAYNSKQLGRLVYVANEEDAEALAEMEGMAEEASNAAPTGAEKARIAARYYDKEGLTPEQKRLAAATVGKGLAEADGKRYGERLAALKQEAKMQGRFSKYNEDDVCNEGESMEAIPDTTPEDMAANEEFAPEAMTEEKQPIAIKNFDKLLADYETATNTVNELRGQLEAANEKLSAALNPDAQAAAADKIINEREEAEEVLNDNMDAQSTREVMNSIRTHHLTGHALRVHALNSIRKKQGKEALSAVNAQDEGFVYGLWTGLRDVVNHKRKVIGGYSPYRTDAMNEYKNYKDQFLRDLGFDVK